MDVVVVVPVVHVVEDRLALGVSCAQPPVVELEGPVVADHAEHVAREVGELQVVRGALLVEPLAEVHRVTAPGDHLIDVGQQVVALLAREALVDAAGDCPRAVHALAGSEADDLLPVLAQLHALDPDGGVILDDAHDVAVRDGVIVAEQEVGRGQVEEVHRVRLHGLTEMHQLTDLEGGRRDLVHPDQHIGRLGGGEVVAHRADAAQPLHDDRQLPVGTALDELLEAPELHDVQACLVDVVVVVQQQRHLAVPLHAGHRLDHDTLQALGIGGGF